MFLKFGMAQFAIKVPHRVVTGVFISLSAGLIAISQSGAAMAQECPSGYRLHYQGFCINQADELADDPIKGVRTVLPHDLMEEDQTAIFARLAKTGYKFSNMEDGEYCKTAYVRISRGEAEEPVAFALGDQSCGFSDTEYALIEDAKKHAMAECQKHTKNCRIIFPDEN